MKRLILVEDVPEGVGQPGLRGQRQDLVRRSDSGARTKLAATEKRRSGFRIPASSANVDVCFGRLPQEAVDLHPRVEPLPQGQRGAVEEDPGDLLVG